MSADVPSNKNAVAGGTSAVAPGGVRIGTSALTSRSMVEADVEKVAEFLHRGIEIALLAQKESGSRLLKDFVAAYRNPEHESNKLLVKLKDEVMKFSVAFPLPGVRDTVSSALRPDEHKLIGYQSAIKRPQGVEF